MSYNKVILMAHLCRDPEMKYTPKGSAVCQFSVATNRKWKTESGEQKEEVCFIDITAWGRTAENIVQYFKKGNLIHIEGRLKLDQWEDKQNGQKRQKLSVVLESFTFCGGTKSEDGGGEGEPERPQRQQSRRETRDTSSRQPDPDPNDAPPMDDDDVPF